MTLAFVLVTVAVFLVLAMSTAWAVILHTGKSGWADTYWSLAIGIAAIPAVLVPLGPGEPTLRAWIVVTLVGVWSLRLGLHIMRRTLAGGDDPRYAQLRQDWGEHYARNLFMFLQIQALAAFVLVVAALATAHRPGPLGLGDFVGIAIAIVAIIGEAFADAQLSAFKRDPANKGRVCDSGLWALSRHPNYFFEWLHWLSYVAIGVSFSGYWWGWLTLLGPVMMYWLLRHASGVPPLEAHMLRSRGDAFRRYQERVSAFWPLPPRGQSE